MDICIAGWYYWPEVYSILNEYAVGHSAYVIANKATPNSKFKEEYKNLRFVVGPDYGLDMGKYNYYLKNIWKGNHGVFFLHDDIVIKSEIDPYLTVLNTIGDNDLAFFFGFDYQVQCQGSYRHMRVMYIGADYLNAMLDHKCTDRTCRECKNYFNVKTNKNVKALPPHTGFLCDPNNFGVVNNFNATSGMRDVNMGARHFFETQWNALRIHRKWKSEKILNDFINHAIRGKLKEHLK